MHRLSALRLPGAILAGAVLIALWIALQPVAAVPPFVPFGDQAVYDARTPAAAAVIEPLMHAPWEGTPPGVVGGALALVLSWAGMLTAIAFGATPAAALTMMAALVLSAPVAATVGHAGPFMPALIGVWLVWWLAAGADRGWSTRQAVIAAMLIVLAGWWSWAVVLALPMVVIGAAGESRGRGLLWVAIAGLAGVMAVSLYLAGLVSRAAVAALPSGLVFGWFDAWDVLAGGFSRQGRAVFVGPDQAAAWTSLSAALVVAALLFHPWPGRLRAGIVATMLWAAAMWVGLADFREELVRFTAWMLTPVAACGLSWAVAQATERWRPAVTAGLATVLIAASLAGGWRPRGIEDARAFASKFAASLASVSAMADSSPKAVVAEDTVVDSAVVAFGGSLHRLPQDAEAAAYADLHGTHVMAGPVARRHLEVFGLVFQRWVAIDTPAPFEWARLVDRYRCAPVREDRWSLLPGLEFTGRIGLELPPSHGGELRLIVGDSLPVAVRVERPDGTAMPAKIETLLQGPSANMPPPDYWFDGGDPTTAPGEIVRVTLAAHPAAPTLAAVHLGRRAPRVLARLRGYPVGARGRVCAAALGVDRFFASVRTREERVPVDDARLFGTGWYGLEGERAHAFRWSAANGVVLVPIEKAGALRVVIRAAAAASGESPTLTLAVNGVEQAPVPMRPGPGDYAWDVPARTWVEGVNDLHFHVSRTVRPADRGAGDRRVLGLALSDLRLGQIQ